MSTHLMFFYGAYLRGQPSHRDEPGCRFIEPAQTRPLYRLFSMGEYPAMRATEAGGVSVAGELYEVESDVREAILADEPPELRCDLVELSDGRVVEGMFADGENVLRGAEDISAIGGWNAFLTRPSALPED